MNDWMNERLNEDEVSISTTIYVCDACMLKCEVYEYVIFDLLITPPHKNHSSRRIGRFVLEGGKRCEGNKKVYIYIKWKTTIWFSSFYTHRNVNVNNMCVYYIWVSVWWTYIYIKRERHPIIVSQRVHPYHIFYSFCFSVTFLNRPSDVCVYMSPRIKGK